MKGNVVSQNVRTDGSHNLLIGTGQVGTSLENKPFLAANSLLTDLILREGVDG